MFFDGNFLLCVCKEQTLTHTYTVLMFGERNICFLELQRMEVCGQSEVRLTGEFKGMGGVDITNL